MSADVVGYSRLMGEDETGTLAALKAHRKELIDPKVAEHNGRIVKLMGDGALVEFPSVVKAMQCAVEIQRGMAERNAAAADDRRIAFRIGINVGDIIIDGEDIYGDGVNVAARLEALAEPGGICISRTTRDQVRDRLDIALDDMGEVEVKNIARPIHVFRVQMGDAARPPPIAKAVATGRTWKRPAAAAALVVLVAAAGTVGWMRPWQSEVVPAPSTGQIGIAVLPFDNMSGDPAQDYFSDGITEDLITDLSRISGLFVIARSTMFTYKGQVVRVRQVGQELGVQYVLEGSVRRAGDRVRVNAQLIDAATGHHLWAERFDRELTGVFALQDEVTQKIVAALAVKLTTQEADRLSRAAEANPEAYDLLLRGLARLRRYTPETNAEAREFFERAIAQNPEYARAYADIAYSLSLDVLFGFSKAPEEDLRRALQMNQTAVELDDGNPQVHFSRSNVFRADRRLDDAIAAARKAIALDPNYADAYGALAITLNYAGRPEEGIEAVRKSMRLNPRHSFFQVWILAQGNYVLGNYEAAVRELQKVVESNSEFLHGHKLLAAAYGQIGRIEDAEWEAGEVLTLQPDFSLKAERARAAYINPGLDRYIDGLRKAGLPE